MVLHMAVPPVPAASDSEDDSLSDVTEAHGHIQCDDQFGHCTMTCGLREGRDMCNLTVAFRFIVFPCTAVDAAENPRMKTCAFSRKVSKMRGTMHSETWRPGQHGDMQTKRYASIFLTCTRHKE